MTAPRLYRYIGSASIRCICPQWTPIAACHKRAGDFALVAETRQPREPDDHIVARLSSIRWGIMIQ